MKRRTTRKRITGKKEWIFKFDWLTFYEHFLPCRYVAENPNLGKDEDSENDDIEYDEDGNPIAPKKSKVRILRSVNLS